MKFGRTLAEKRVPAWAFYYLDYNVIKKTLVAKVVSKQEEQGKEQRFIETVEKELQKINSFHVVKTSELEHQIKDIKKRLKSLQKEGADPDTWYDEVTSTLDHITQEILNLDDFKKLNVLAFSKLFKKHDKKNDGKLKDFWMFKLQKEIFVQNHTVLLDKMFLKLSACWFIVNTMRFPPQKKEKKGEDGEKKGPTQQNFERSTTKYWVPMDKVPWIKLFVLKRLPILSFNKRSESLITSVYYDSEDLVLYHERLKRDEGSQIIRMRTYNEPPHSTVFVERKVHHDTWVGEKSVKSRFPIKEKFLYKYVQGKFNMTDKLNKLKEANKISDKEFDQIKILSDEIQESIVTRKLQPTMTSRYWRSAFQLDDDASVRISLDANMDLIHEYGYAENTWGRDKSNIPEKDVCHFPHAILEVKLSMAMGEAAPEWVKELLKQDFVIRCGKFSKFIHGCAILIPEKTNLLPSWLDLLEETSDFKVDPKITIANQHPKHTDSNSKQVQIDVNEIEMSDMKKKRGKEEDDDGDKKEKKSKKERKEPREPKEGGEGLRQRKTENSNDKPPKSNGDAPKKQAETPKPPPQDPNAPAKLGGWGIWNNLGAVFRRDKKKKIQVPMRIEPKTFFANERTFIQWMSFIIIIQGIGFGLMSLGKKPLSPLHTGGLVFVVLALVMMVYAIFLFEIRRRKISAREKGPYDDPVGPLLLVGLLMIGLIINIVLTYINYVDTCKGIKLLDNDWYVYNPSELLWHKGKNRLLTVGPNVLTYIDVTEYTTEDHIVMGDLEAICQVPGRDGLLYIGREYPPAILEYEESTGEVLRTIPLNLQLPANPDPDVAMEGLTYIPEPSYPTGGFFWAASQFDGYIYIYDVNLTQANITEFDVFTIDRFQPIAGMNSIQALNYHEESGLVYGIGRKWLFAINPADRSVVYTHTLGISNPEGVAIVGTPGGEMTAYVACDACNEAWKFGYTDLEGILSGRCTSAQSSVSS